MVRLAVLAAALSLSGCAVGDGYYGGGSGPGDANIAAGMAMMGGNGWHNSMARGAAAQQTYRQPDPPTPYVHPTYFAPQCERGHWIKDVATGGRGIRLDDGSVWAVAVLSRVTASIWLPMSNVLTCPGRIENLDTHENIEAQQIA